MCIKKIRLFTLTLFISNLITGCSVLQVDKDKNSRPIDVVVLSTSKINPDLNANPSPLKFSIYQLEKKELFSDLNYFEITDSEVLKENKIETMLQPDSLQYLSLQMTNDSKYLGVVGGFQDIENSKWRMTFIKQPDSFLHSFENYLYLKVESNTILQLSNEQMKSELINYHKQHPDDERVTRRGKFQKPRMDYSKGIFLQNN